MAGEPTIRPVVVLSRCLGRTACRYDGRAIYDPFVARLAPLVTFRTVCPEVALRLGIPRDAIRLVDDGRGGVRLVQPATGLDLTKKMRAFARRFLRALGPVDGFLLKSRSPSCGIGNVKVYSADGRRVVRRQAGIFAAAVRACFPGLAIVEEGSLRDSSRRRRFLARYLAGRSR